MLDLVWDVHMYLLFKEGMIGGVSCISKRYIKANNKCLTSYNPIKPTKYITYLDKNNLYGYALSKYFSMSGFNSIDPAKFNLEKYDDNSFRGYILEADLEHPKKLQELHNDSHIL